MNATEPACPPPRRFGVLLLAWLVLLTIDTVGQVAIKTAGMRVGIVEPDLASLIAAASTPWLWLGLACYIGQFVVWMVILEKSALSRAFPTSAVVFVSIMAASWVVFGETMGWAKLLGSAIIIAGILLLGSDAESGAPPPGPGHSPEGTLQ